MSERVVLSVPARAEYAKTVRITAAALVSRMGMSYDDVDDVRMATEEAFVYACARAGEDSIVDVAFTLDSDACGIQVGPVARETEPTEEEQQLGRYATFILQSVCDEFEIRDDETGCSISMRKRHARPEGARA